jgi:hypothetical protein
MISLPPSKVPPSAVELDQSGAFRGFEEVEKEGKRPKSPNP